jgi:glycosyltransferase involved in cell wall biosynthesis
MSAVSAVSAMSAMSATSTLPAAAMHHAAPAAAPRRPPPDRDMPCVSIITVVFNARELLGRTIASIAALEYPRIEYIVVDGGSTDGTLELVERHRDCIARAVSERDAGIYDAMNKGIGLATGDYIWFLNAGDTPASPHVLDGLLADGQPPDFLFGDTNLMEEDGTLRTVARTPATLTWQAMAYGMKVSHQSFVARRALVPRYDLRYRYIADQKWIVDILRVARRGLRVPGPMSNYLMGGLSDRLYVRFMREKIRYAYAEHGVPRATAVALGALAGTARSFVGRVLRRRSGRSAGP